jgi:hypothetical protein
MSREGGGGAARFEGALSYDYSGARYLLGRTADRYAIWDRSRGGEPVRTFPLTDQGWAEAWLAYRELEGPGAEPVTTATWQRGRPIPLVPMGVGQIIGGAFRLFGNHFGRMVAIVAPVLIPFQALLLAFTLITLELRPVPTDGGTVLVPLPAPWVGWAGNAVYSLIVTPFLTAAVLRAAADAFLGAPVTVNGAYRAALPRILSILWVSILVSLAVLAFLAPGIFLAVVWVAVTEGPVSPAAILLLLAGVVPSIYVVIRWLFGTTVVMVEGDRGVAALRRSWRLIQGRWWRTFGTLLLVGLILFGALLVVGLILLVPVLSGGVEGITPGFYVLSAVVNTAAGLVITPFATLVIVLLYFDARIRTDGIAPDELAGAGGGR